MNIAIVGAGITGISTALELARDGHQVTVYEQMNATAEEASFAPGGWLSPCVAPSLSAPGVGMPLKQLQKGSGLLQASTFLGSNTWRWMRQWKKHEKQAFKQGAHPLFSALQALSSYSQDLRWQDCEDPESIAEQRPGALVLLRNPQTGEVTFVEAGSDAPAWAEGMLGEHVLHLARPHLVARGVDLVLETVDEVDPAVAVDDNFRRFVSVRELAGNRLQYVQRRNQPLYDAKLVSHDDKATAGAAQHAQQIDRVQRFRDHNRRRGGSQSGNIVTRFQRHQHLFRPHDTDDFIQLAAADREQAVR